MRRSNVGNKEEDNDDDDDDDEEEKSSVDGIAFRSIQSKNEEQSEESKSEDEEDEENEDDSQDEEEISKKNKLDEKVFKFHEKRFTNADKRALLKYVDKGIGKLESYEFYHFMAVK